jgi:Ni2+-binding GTPase involved in maturation of urease and hydrogenase
MKKPFIVGITGGSASGKTLFLDKLLHTFEPSEVCLISQDNYYKPRHLQPIDDKAFTILTLPTLSILHNMPKIYAKSETERRCTGRNTPSIIPIKNLKCWNLLQHL